MTTTEDAPSSPPLFSLFLPEGFIELHAGEPDLAQLRSLAADIAGVFGLDPGAEIDQGLAESTVLLTTAAAASAAGGSSYTAAGFFRSPDDPNRPIMALVSCFCVESSHTSANVAIAGLEEVHRRTSNGPVEVVELPAGPAVVAQSTTPGRITLGEDSVAITEHAITAWIPGPKVVLGLAVTSNNTEDWPHVADLASGLFETFEWADDDHR